MDKKELKRLITEYVAGNLSANDRRLLQEWYDSFGEDEKGIPALEDEETALRIEEALLVGTKQNRLPSAQKDIALRRSAGWKPWAAAAVLILALEASLWQIRKRADDSKMEKMAHATFREVKTGVRQLKQLTLPDNSIIYLNANSVIRIPETEHGRTRRILLDEGEAYFEVARDSLRPFVVQTASGVQIEVLGTAFNVRSYKKLDDISVAVSHGKVRVSDTASVLAELKATEGIRYHKADGQTWKTKADPEQIKTWLKGSVQLEEARFSELALVMYNLFGVQLKSAGDATETYRYNLNVSTEYSLEDMMKVICSIHKTTYRRKGNEITIYP